MVEAGKRYRSFISYSQQDRAWGRRLQSWLETYRVPVGVLADVQGSQRLGRFFRDEAEMPAAPDIGEVVRHAIETAESLIVICSPRSAHSTWVSAEIAHFRKINPNGKLLAVIIDGEANSDDPEQECFPAELRRKLTSLDGMPVEPVGVDVRVDSKARICARLAAGLLDVDFDDLWQRDRRRADRHRRRTLEVFAALTVSFAALAGAALWFAFDAGKQSRAAEAARLTLQAEYLAMLGESGIDEVLASDAVPGALEPVDSTGWTSLMRRDQDDFILAREFGEGRIFAVAHDGVLNAARMEHGDRFLRRAVNWLRGASGRSTLVISSGHCEWVSLGAPGWLMPDLLRAWGYEVRDAPDGLTDQVLADAGVLVVGNGWSAFEPSEIDAIERFVSDGGGILMAGLGWSWLEHANDPELACPGEPAPDPATLESYPMNILGARFGVRWNER